MGYLSYCLRETGANVFDYRGLSIVALVTSALSMLCVGLFFLIYVNSYKVVQSFEEQITISLYLDEGLSKDQTLALERALRSYPAVSDVEFVSHRDAVVSYLERYPKEEAVVTSLGEQALPTSFVLGLAPTHRTVEGCDRVGQKA